MTHLLYIIATVIALYYSVVFTGKKRPALVLFTAVLAGWLLAHWL